MDAHSDAEIATRLFKDQKRYKTEEARRFEAARGPLGTCRLDPRSLE